MVEIAGSAQGRAPGSCEIWRYRAAGALFLQVEKWPDTVVVLAGGSIPKGMFEHMPAL